MAVARMWRTASNDGHWSLDMDILPNQPLRFLQAEKVEKYM